ncbi:GNAT family N-acetyltransferase [Novosphingobium olei]|uniref:GNAT family N-acetyltransferase n=1 Tax=Novosphingobium olei TaxID=2728851 RepID=A0A7Y0BPT6_9SPHN|nr:GNAT family N-acetyltransferase [Novosphingobium olei]
MRIRDAAASDVDAIWAILEPVIRAGETYALDRDMSRDAALSYWFGADKQTLVAEDNEGIVGTYYLRANQPGGGSHVCNCGYITAAFAAGRGVARAMCADSLERARAAGFAAMQFNFVVSTNVRAVALWTSLGFAIVGRLPDAFDHPALGRVDALVMHRAL